MQKNEILRLEFLLKKIIASSDRWHDTCEVYLIKDLPKRVVKSYQKKLRKKKTYAELLLSCFEKELEFWHNA